MDNKGSYKGIATKADAERYFAIVPMPSFGDCG